MGREHVRYNLRADWRPDNPTKYYCNVVSQVVLKYLAPPSSRIYEVIIPHQLVRAEPLRSGKLIELKHYFVKDPQGRIYDLTCDQFDASVAIDYDSARPVRLQPSRRVKLLARLLKLERREG